MKIQTSQKTIKKIVFFSGLCLMGMILFISCLFYFLHAEKTSRIYSNTDFFTFYQSMRFYFSGQNLYSPIINLIEINATKNFSYITLNNNLNPPFLTLILLPFYTLNYADALKIWIGFSLLCMLASMGLLLKAFPVNKKYHLPILVGFAVYVPNAIVFSYGQISHIILILLTGAFLLGRHKKDISAGVLIGLMCALKIFCGLFLIYFLVIKRFKLLASALITGLMAFLASLSIFGLSNYLHYKTVLESICWYPSSWNASFLGFFTRVFSSTDRNTAFINIPNAANNLTVIFSGLLIFYLIYAWRKLGSQNFETGFSLVIIAMLLLSPLGWMYYFGFLMIPYYVLIYKSRNDWMHFIACIGLFFSTLAGNLLKTDIKTPQQIFYNSGVGFYVLIVLLSLYIYMIHKITSNKKDLLPVNIFSSSIWLLLYSVAFIPSFASQVFFIKNFFKLT